MSGQFLFPYIRKENSEKSNVSSEESEWEEVENETIGTDSEDEKEPVIPEEGVEITIALPESERGKKKKREFDLASYLRRKVNRYKKDVQVAVHKVHLLCLLAHGLRVNAILRDQLVRALALSLIPDYFLSSENSLDNLERLVGWFRRHFKATWSSNDPIKCCIDTGRGSEYLLRALETKEAACELGYVSLLLLFVRVVGYDGRLVFAFQPLPFRVSSSSSDLESKTVGQPSKASKTVNISKTESTLKNACKKRPSTEKRKTTVDKETGGELDQSPANRRRSNRGSTKTSLPKYKDESTEGEEDDGEQTRDRKKKVPALRKSGTGDSGKDSAEQTSKKRRTTRKSATNDDQPFEAKTDVKDEESNPKKNSPSHDHWIEVYIPKGERWMCVNCFQGSIDRPLEIEDCATKPLTYVVAFSSDGSAKDVTRRYASGWLSTTRKLRVSEPTDWWEDALRPFRPKVLSERERREDGKLDEALQKRPLPTTISEFKNHPLYVLKRHLLKFQAIYPPNCPSVGFIHGEAVYARECVHVLHSRETWLKEARVVLRGESPYKVVKARPKWSRQIGNFQTDLPLEVFGRWQTEEYIPPPAQDGKVPRNEYGNVELFKPSMLPKGTVHLQIPGLNRVAKKLGIDCAAAMVGWDFHGVGSHPSFDGWVVCEEFKDVLLDAWNEDQEIQAQREHDKKEKRVYGNWRRLIRGLLIRQRIQRKYNSGNPIPSTSSSPSKKSEDPKPGKAK